MTIDNYNELINPSKHKKKYTQQFRASYLGQLCHMQNPHCDLKRFSKSMIQQSKTRFSCQLQ